MNSPDLNIDPQSDLFSPSIVKELLEGTTEWVNIQEIIKLTFKAIYDILNVHAISINDLQKSLSGKATKTEMNSSLSSKANISDVSKSISDLSSHIQQRATHEETINLLEEKVSKSELQFILSSRVLKEDLIQLMNEKMSIESFNLQMKNIFDKLDNMNNYEKELVRKYDDFVTKDEVKNIYNALDQKANLSEVMVSLESKASKQSVINSLQKKANKIEMDKLLLQKIDLNEFSKITKDLQEELNTLVKSNDEVFVKLKSEFDYELIKVKENLENKSNQSLIEVKNDFTLIQQDTFNKLQNLKDEIKKDLNSKIEATKVVKFDNEYKEINEKKYQETISLMNASMGLLK